MKLLISQINPPTREGTPLYPVFDVSLQNPLPSESTFISTTANFVLPPVFGFVSIIIGISITRSIIKAFQDK